MNGSLSDKRKKVTRVATGIIGRLFGAGLIVLGDGHDTLWSKGLVIAALVNE